MSKSEIPSWAKGAKVIRGGKAPVFQRFTGRVHDRRPARAIDLKKLAVQRAIETSRNIDKAVQVHVTLEREAKKFKYEWDKFIEHWLTVVMKTYHCTIEDLEVRYSGDGLFVKAHIFVDDVPILGIYTKENEPGEFTFHAELFEDDGTNDGGAVPPTQAS